MGKHLQEGLTTTSGLGFVVDEDNMASDSATKVPTQQSTKAYVDSLRNINLMTNEGGSTIGDTTTETSIQTGTITITAGTLRNGDTIELTYAGLQQNNSGGAITATNRLKLNGSAVVSPNFSQATNGFSPHYHHEIKLTRMTATTLLMVGRWYVSSALNIGQGNQQVIDQTVTVSDVDSNNLTIDMTFQWASANAAAVVTPEAVMARIVRV